MLQHEHRQLCHYTKKYKKFKMKFKQLVKERNMEQERLE